MDLNVIRAVFIILHIYISASSTFPGAVTSLVAIAFYDQFTYLDTRFKTFLEGAFDGELFEDLRVQYQDRCKLLRRADSFVSLHNGASVVGKTIISILVFYGLAWNKSSVSADPIAVVMAVFWLSWSMVGLMATLASGVLVNYSVSIDHAFRIWGN